MAIFLQNVLSKLGTTNFSNPTGIVKGWVFKKSEKVKPGQVFFAEGLQVAGLVREAFNRGALAVVVHNNAKVPEFPNKCLIRTSSVRHSFFTMVRLYRLKFPINIVGITGSVGKSTTKEMIASILQLKCKIIKTKGNGNLSTHVLKHVSNLTKSHQAMVLEMGMDRYGEIAAQAYMTYPNIGIITQIGEAHIGNLGGKIENVIKAKQELINFMNPKGTLILNKDDPSTAKFNLSRFQGTLIFFGFSSAADYQAVDYSSSTQGTTFTARLGTETHRFLIPIFGKHNIYNALAAIAAAHSLGIDVATIKKGLASYSRPKWRLQLTKGLKKSLLINDTYNANPTSVKAGLDVLADLGKNRKKVAVLGDMLELGSRTASGHREVGKYVVNRKINKLITIGRAAKHIALAAQQAGMPKNQIFSFTNRQAAANFLKNYLLSQSVVLFKASRNMRLEKLVRLLQLPSKKKK